ncbi:MAG: LPS-assembly protein LptD [Bacteroidales bacterium]|nr:LPS-assembly protein LptD [Bacteroidales bacterium]
MFFILISLKGITQIQSDTTIIHAEVDSSYQHIPVFDTIAGFGVDSLSGDSLNKAISLFPPDSVYLSDSSFRKDRNLNDTGKQKKKSSALESTVLSTSNDSITFNMKARKAYLYNAAQIDFDKIKLNADYVEIDFKSNEVYASGVTDSTGKEIGKPIFNEGTTTFKSTELRYNYNTSKGIIKDVITEEGEGFLHGSKVKKMDDNASHLRHGSYTTCNLDHPHFDFSFTKAKVIPGEKLITGPIYPRIAGVPLPIGLPFAYLPQQQGRRSGILIPTYGNSPNRGYYFQNGGYYFGINDYLDMEIKGSIYTRGSWSLTPKIRYNKRYSYNGNFAFGYAVNIDGEQGSDDYQQKKDFSVTWRHAQDPKARPNSRFSADVNIKSSKFNEYNPVSVNDQLSNTFQSSVSYQTKIANKYNITASMRHTQNTKTHDVSMTLPDLNFSAPRFYPLRKKIKSGKSKWYEDISVNYSMSMKNELKTKDSLLSFDNLPYIVDDFRNGMQHKIPISHSAKVLKYFNLTTSVNYNERWYSRKIEQDWAHDSIVIGPDTLFNEVIRDTVYGFHSVRDFSASTSLGTTIYGQKQFTKGPLKAVRHVIKPSVGLSYNPDFSTPFWGYYDTYTDDEGEENQYSYYDGSLYFSVPQRKGGNANFKISNNIEIKVRSKKDTISGMRKIKLIEDLSLSTSYNLAADSLNWSTLRLSGRTTLFKGLKLSVSASYDPYIKDAKGKRWNKFEWNENKRLFRRDNTDWRLSFSYDLNGEKIKKLYTSDHATEAEIEEVNEYQDEFIDWNNPWNVRMDYSLGYTNTYQYALVDYEKKFIHALGFNGSVNVTEKWKVGFMAKVDVEKKKFSYATLNLYRDLHCWQMRFNWTPLGTQKGWNFTISAKSSLLQDLKLERKRDFNDRF